MILIYHNLLQKQYSNVFLKAIPHPKNRYNLYENSNELPAWFPIHTFSSNIHKCFGLPLAGLKIHSDKRFSFRRFWHESCIHLRDRREHISAIWCVQRGIKDFSVHFSISSSILAENGKHRNIPPSPRSSARMGVFTVNWNNHWSNHNP